MMTPPRYRDGPQRGYYRGGLRGAPRILRGGYYRGIIRRPRDGVYTRDMAGGGYRDSGYIPRKRPYPRGGVSPRRPDSKPQRDKKKEVAVPFACTLCTVSMKTEGDISDHLNSDDHSKNISKLYDEFDRRFKVFKDMARADADVGRATYEMKRFKEQQQGKEPEKIRAWRCDVCACNVIESQSEHDKKETHRELDSMQNVPCGVCKRKFTTRADFERHLMSFSHYDRLAAPDSGDDDRGMNLEEMATVDEVGEGDDEGMDTMEGDEEEGKKPPPVIIGPFDPQVAVGQSFVEEYRLAKCLLCEEEFRAREIGTHCRTEGHYERFVEKLKEDHDGNVIVSEAVEEKGEVEGAEEETVNGAEVEEKEEEAAGEQKNE